MLGSTEIQRLECERLLTSDVVGRVALCTPSGPHISPVDYAVIDHMIVFRTSNYSVLGTHGRNAVLAFQADDFEDQAQGWSVQATGRGEVITAPDTLEHIREMWPLRPWSVGMRHLVLRLPSTILSGSRTGTARAASSATYPRIAAGALR